MQSKNLVVKNDLKSFFYEELMSINQSISHPLAQETLYYSSTVLEKYSLSNVFFEVLDDGRKKDKLLGIKLLETTNIQLKDKRMRAIKDVAETALVLCGYFPPATEKKLVNVEYYENLAKTAYGQLNSIEPSYLDISDFYLNIASIFDKLVALINIFANKSNDNIDIYDKYLLISGNQQNDYND